MMLIDESREKRSPGKDLKGIDEISRYLNDNNYNVYQYYRFNNLPMTIKDGVWMAKPNQLDDWKDCQRKGSWYEITEKKRTGKPKKNELD